MSSDKQSENTSPFHTGEQALQTRAGVRDQMEWFGSRVIRDYMPEQHRMFYHQLPFVFVGHQDQAGWPWASILFNPPGFMSSKDPRHLSVLSKPIEGDPLSDSLSVGLNLGLLGIELPTRRRNRLSAKVVCTSQNGFDLSIEQTFGNCPQYIQTRELDAVDAESLPTPTRQEMAAFDATTKKLISSSDTFFVASYADDGSGAKSQGADVSHRGGRPGFIRIDDDRTLTIPDYIGNNHFNTLGNFVENNKAGLLFLDFENGHLLTLTGTVELLWDSPETKHFDGADRLWRFTLSQGRYIRHALPLRWTFQDYSPNTSLTGTWEEAEALSEASKSKDGWRPYVIKKIEQESDVISSFYLEAKGHQALSFRSGQFLTLKASIGEKELIRTYSLSNAPSERYFRISVKREPSIDGALPEGQFSNYLHHHAKVGDTLLAQSPRGAFTFTNDSDRPALLLGAGVGIAPLISMARHALVEGVRTRSIRPITFIGAAKSHAQRAFFTEFQDIESASQQQIMAYWTLSEISPELKPGIDFHHKGRICKELLQSILPQDDYDVYLCGPAGFMQSTYDLLRSLGINDERIHAESFGPASLYRQTDQTAESTADQTATNALVEFADSQVEQVWSVEDGSLLAFAESHGFSPDFACRSGQCGACKVPLLSGKVAYQTDPIAPVNEDEVLLCCSMPAASQDEKEEITKISIKL